MDYGECPKCNRRTLGKVGVIVHSTTKSEVTKSYLFKCMFCIHKWTEQRKFKQ